MTWITGTASDAADLIYTQLKMAASSSGWAVVRDDPGAELVLVSPLGAAVAIRDDEGEFELQGSTGFQSDRPLGETPGAIPAGLSPGFSLGDTPIDYKISVTDWRILLIADGELVAHMGYLQPFGNANDYPFPLFVGGPGLAGGYNGLVMLPGKSWAPLRDGALMWPDEGESGSATGSLGTCLDGSQSLHQAMVYEYGSSARWLGVIEGLSVISSDGVSAGDSINHAGSTWTVASSGNNFCAVREA